MSKGDSRLLRTLLMGECVCVCVCVCVKGWSVLSNDEKVLLLWTFITVKVSTHDLSSELKKKKKETFNSKNKTFFLIGKETE